MSYRSFSRDGIHTAELFRKINSILNQRMRESFQEVGITPPQMMILHYLYKHNECKVSDISRDLHLATSTVSSILDRLERNQLVIRRRQAEDKRIVQIVLSDKAIAWKDSLHMNLDETMESMVQHATDEELGKIVSGLQLMRDVLNRDTKIKEREDLNE